jgi:hypothetical protein
MNIKTTGSTLLIALNVLAVQSAMPLTQGSGSAAAPDVLISALPEQFAHPPRAARPATWWHWVDDNVSKEGITADLEAMKKAGLSAAVLFAVTENVPSGSVRFGSDEWFAMADHTLREAARLDLEIGAHNCAGWSQSGGPWVSVKDSMKRVAWSETAVQGGRSVSLKLQQPAAEKNFYRDISVFAVPESPGGQNLLAAVPSDLQAQQLQQLMDGDWISGGISPGRDESGTCSVFTVQFAQPVEAASFFAAFSTPLRDAPVQLEAFTGGQWHSVAEASIAFGSVTPYRILSANCKEPVTAERFRLSIRCPPSARVKLSELALSTAPRVPMAGVLAGFHDLWKQFALPDIPLDRWGDPNGGIPSGEILNLTEKMSADGTLNWAAPPGDWTVLRIGYTVTGVKNHPATKEGQGLEVDKMDEAAVGRFFDGYMGKLADLAAALPKNPLRYCLADSWEVGPQNWTADFPRQFEKYNGYSLDTWLVALTGRIIDSPVRTKQFLYDFRSAVSDSIADNYEGGLRRKCESRGMALIRETYGMGNFSSLRSGYQASLPADEFWTSFAIPESLLKQPKSFPEAVTEVPELGSSGGFGARAASAAYTAPPTAWRDGRVSAESFTSRPTTSAWQLHPRALKRLGDAAFVSGINWFMMHSYAHQPYSQIYLPGVTVGRWGFHFDRNNTWFPMAGAWIDYLSRCQALLQSGRSVREVCVVTEKEVDQPTVPAGIGPYAVIYAVPAGLKNARIEEGNLVLASGSRHNLLWVNSNEAMTPELLQTIAELLRQGGTIVAQKPRRSLSLRGQPEADSRVAQLADQLWGDGVPAKQGDRRIGKGRLLWGCDVQDALKKSNVPVDFAVDGNESDPQTPILSCHRCLPGKDIYFLANRSKVPQQFTGLFRSGQPVVSLWNPVNGTRHAVQPEQTPDGRWKLPLKLDVYESVFVIFGESSEPAPPVAAAAALPLTNSWTVSFQPGRGAPEKIKLDRLTDLSKHPDDGVRHFSGVMTYRTSFECPAERIRSDAEINFQQVEVIAEVELNGKLLGTLWTFPNRLSCAGALNPGRNELVVRVANTWVNRLIGDARLPDDAEWRPDTLLGPGRGAWLKEWPDWFKKGEPVPGGRITFATYKWWTAEDALMPSGLIGDVEIKAGE